MLFRVIITCTKISISISCVMIIIREIASTHFVLYYVVLLQQSFRYCQRHIVNCVGEEREGEGNVRMEWNVKWDKCLKQIIIFNCFVFFFCCSVSSSHIPHLNVCSCFVNYMKRSASACGTNQWHNQTMCNMQIQMKMQENLKWKNRNWNGAIERSNNIIRTSPTDATNYL